jgi:hypothetical protein
MLIPMAIVLLLVAIALIVYGRVNRRRPGGNWIAVAGYATLAVAFVVGLVGKGLIG